mmetsp:Transcript_17783/g.34455  ORF Transcript_17783/g.34455 Transcript_17783/m.34455 type:complete len:307 (-) Transcript_17783:214-1134(-)
MVNGRGIYALEEVQILSWLLKDFSWLLLYPELSFPLGIAAVCLQGGLIYHKRQLSDVAHEVGVLLWIAGNFIWMAAETMYDDADADINLGGAPVIGVNHGEYKRLSRATTVFFVSSLAVLFLDLIYVNFIPTVKRNVSSLRMDEDAPEETMNMPERVYAILWVSKDLAWLHQGRLVACLAAALAITLGGFLIATAYSHRFHDGNTNFLLAIVSEFWLLAMTVWMLGELFGDDQQRSLAAVVFCCGFIAYVYFLVTESKLRRALSLKQTCASRPAKHPSPANEIGEKVETKWEKRVEDEESLLGSQR